MKLRSWTVDPSRVIYLDNDARPLHDEWGSVQSPGEMVYIVRYHTCLRGIPQVTR